MTATLPEIAGLFVTILTVVLLAVWGFYTLMVLTVLLFEEGPESTPAAFRAAFQNLVPAMALGAVMLCVEPLF